MHHTRKKKALALIEGQTDTVTVTKTLLENEFTDQEVSEIIGSLSSSTTPETTVEEDKAPAKQKVVKPAKNSAYKLYDLWLVDISRKETKDRASGQIKVEIDSFTTIKKLRENVKLEASVIRDLNAQSHNSLRRYYESGTVTNGNVEKADITTTA